MRNNNITRAKRRRGASIVELAITMPVLLIFLLGIVDAGQFANCYQAISNASREGARIAARSSAENVNDVETFVMDYLDTAFGNASASELAGGVTVTVKDEGGSQLSGSQLATVTTGEAIEVTVSIDFDVIRIIPGLDSFDNRSLAATTIMRRE